MNRLRRFKFVVIVLSFIILMLGVFAYYSYFYYTEGRNSSQNDNAYNIHILTKHYIEDNPNIISSNMILSNNPKYEMNNSNNINIEEILRSYSQKENVFFDDGCYYIEIRNKAVYKVIYSKWKYSGFVGMSPIPNGKCTIYKEEVDKSINDFNNYINSK